MQEPASPEARDSIYDFIRQEIRILELLFDDRGLVKLRQRRPSHPAVTRHDLMARFVDKALPLRYPNEVDLVLTIGSIAIDSLSITQTPEAVVAALDVNVLRELRARVGDPNQFADQMTALTCWSMILSRGLSADVVEKEGLPDVRVAVGDPARMHWIEAKRVRLGKKAEQLRHVIGYANKQIKRAQEGVGSVYLYIERPQQRVVFDDNVPSAIQPYLDEADRELRSGHSRSVAEVIVAWDDYMILGSPPDRTSYFLRRRSVLLHHSAPRAESLLPPDALGLGRTVMLSIDWSVSAGSLIGADSFARDWSDNRDRALSERV